MTYSVEEWKPVVGYEGFYEVSNVGHVRRIYFPNEKTVVRILRGSLNNDGYLRVYLYRDGYKPKTRTIHSLVADAFLGPRCEGMTVNHINSVKTDNRLRNLEYVTALENINHAYINGNYTFGERNGRSKLVESDIPVIRAKIASGRTQDSVAHEYQISQSTVSSIISGKLWKFVA